MKVTFVKTRYVYDSYSDFWKLVQLSNFPCVYVDEMDMYAADTLYITAPYNGEWKPHLDNYPDRTAKFMLWNLERPGDRTVEDYRRDNQLLIDTGYFHDVIVSDRWLARETGFKYAPVGSHKDLALMHGEVYGATKLYDAVHLMCYSLRRAFMFDYITPHTKIEDMTIAPNGWDAQRHASLVSSRYMLNIHQDDHRIMEPLRFALAASYGLPIISEHCHDPYPYTVGTGALSFCEPNRASVLLALRQGLSLYRLNSRTAMAQRELMCGLYSFRNCIERYI